MSDGGLRLQAYGSQVDHRRMTVQRRGHGQLALPVSLPGLIFYLRLCKMAVLSCSDAVYHGGSSGMYETAK